MLLTSILLNLYVTNNNLIYFKLYGMKHVIGSEFKNRNIVEP